MRQLQGDCVVHKRQRRRVARFSAVARRRQGRPPSMAERPYRGAWAPSSRKGRMAAHLELALPRLARRGI